MRLDVLEEFAEAQSWVHGAIAQAETRHALRLHEQRERWEETRRLTLAVSREHRIRRAESQSKYEHKRYAATKADPVKRAAHNAKRMAAYYRKKEREAREALRRLPAGSRVPAAIECRRNAPATSTLVGTSLVAR
jgi:hypothetical protein